MAFRNRMTWTSVAVAATLIVGVPTLSRAQGRGAAPATGAQAPAQARGRGRGAPVYFTPAPDAKDLKSVLFKWGWYMGMLRSNEEYDVLMTLEYTGKGTMQVDGQPCNMTKYRTSISYRDSGERIQITGTRPNGQSCNNIEVLSGAYAWNEDIPGAELDPGKGKATPMPATVAERMIRLWAGPQGAWKAAMAGTKAPNAPDLTARPQKVPADVMTVGKTSVTWEGSTPVLTFPIPGVPTAMATARLNDKFMAERVTVKDGAKTYEFDYSNYKDWNNPLNPAEAFYAGRMIEKQNGAVVRDITTTGTETGQMYVIMPVPASVRASMTPTLQPANWTLTFNNPPAPIPPAPTPRRADGHVDLTGVWGGAPNPITGGGARRCGPTQVKGAGINPEVGCREPMDNFWVDYEWLSPSRFGVWGLPTYKPEFWDKIQELDQWTNKDDPIMTCQPIGIPRHGTPRRIIQTDKDVIFFYGANADYGGGNEEFRDIPTDGRQRNPRVASLTTYYGESIGTWEGDTLVIDSINFVDSTWLGRGGFFHSDNMHIIEKLTRVGNELRYDMTVEDPDSFVQPWVMKTRVLRQGGGFGPFGGGDGIQPERAYCEVYEEGNVTTQLRH